MGKDLKGKELGECLSQRKDGRYQARYTDRWGNRKYMYDSSLRELRIRLAEAIAENEKFTSVKKNLLLDDWFDRWIEIYKERSVRPNTLREYVNTYKKNISPYIGGREINSLVKSDIQLLIDYAHDHGYGYERQNKIRIMLHDILQRASEDDFVAKNPVSGIRLRASKEIKAHALTVDEQNDFFECCKGTFYENLFNVAVNTGLRPGELFALQEDDIDLKNRTIDVNKTLVYQKYLTDDKKEFHIEPPKTEGSKRKVPINSICLSYLKKQFALKKIIAKKDPRDRNDYLFVTKYNTPINSQIFNDAIKKIIAEINTSRAYGDYMEDFSGHTFRHTFATRCFENGIDAKIVQTYLGHASLKMTMDLYTHVTEETSFEEIERLVSADKPENIISLRRKMG